MTLVESVRLNAVQKQLFFAFVLTLLGFGSVCIILVLWIVQAIKDVGAGWALASVAGFVVGGLLLQYFFPLFVARNFVPKSLIRNEIEQRVQHLRRMINEHSFQSEEEVRVCEEAIRKLLREMAELPAVQAKRLAEYKEKLNEAEDTLASLKK